MPLEEGEYFIQDLIGLTVVDADTGEEYGTLSDVSQTGANDVYHISKPGKSEKLIPAIRTWWLRLIWTAASCGSGR